MNDELELLQPILLTGGEIPLLFASIASGIRVVTTCDSPGSYSDRLA